MFDQYNGGYERGQGDSALGGKRRHHNERNYETGDYWNDRADLMYYRYVDFILRTLARDATSILDVGTASCPYLEWFDWIDERLSFDRATPYESETVIGLQGDFFTYDFGRRFDVCTCLQVLEHIPAAEEFAQRLLAVSDLVVVSVPWQWPAGRIKDHVHDPVTMDKLTSWFGREPTYSIVVEEPFRAPKRLIAVFDADPDPYGYGKKAIRKRVRRDDILPPVSEGG